MASKKYTVVILNDGVVEKVFHDRIAWDAHPKIYAPTESTKTLNNLSTNIPAEPKPPLQVCEIISKVIDHGIVHNVGPLHTKEDILWKVW